MRTENLRCDWCKKLTTEEGKWKKDLHGFAITLGYSRRGWGSRQDFVRPRNYELCGDCFAAAESKSLEFDNLIAERTGQTTFTAQKAKTNAIWQLATR